MYSFYAFLARMKYINRWGLMKNLQPENIAEHSQQTAIIAHALAVIENKIFGKNLDANKVGMMAVFHDISEVLIGDMPTPVKYFSPEIAAAYKNVESDAEERLLNMLPNELRYDIESIIRPEKTSYEYTLVKCADKLSAYIKCVEELRSLNNEFKSAHDTIKTALEKMAKTVPSLDYFLKNFAPMYYKNLDDLV